MQTSAATGTKLSSSLRFPESQYPIAKHRKRVYLHRNKVGYRKMENSRAVVCAITRNTASVLLRTITQVELLMDCFRDCRVVIFENDSEDDTPEMLSAWAKEDHRVTYLEDDFQDPVHRSIRCLKRAARMAFYRNVVRTHALEKYQDYDYVIVLDTDLDVGFSLDGVANTFGHGGWDVVGSNGIIWEQLGDHPRYPVQYDAWAFRFQDSWRSPPNIEVNQLTFKRGERLLPVYSCFGGLAVYRMAAYRTASYNGSDCEHVPMHRMLRYNGFGRQFLNPSMICDYGSR